MSYDSDVVSATSGHGEADWDKIIKLCNRIRESVGPTSMHQAMLSVMRRVKHSSPNVQLHALTLLEACVSNCGKDFQTELTTPSFQAEVKSILLGPYSDPRVTQRLKELLASWTAEFKSAPHMNNLIKFVEQLRREGVSFSGPQLTSPPTTSTPSPAQATRSREDEDLRRAIQLSLQDSKATPPPSSSSSTSAATSSKPAKKESSRKVRAIYDFQAAEDNELSFRAGEIITVLDDSDENWWRGETQLGEGLFPASFVSKNLNVDPEPSQQEKKSKKKTKAASERGQEQQRKPMVNEEKVDLLLEMLRSADVTDASQDESKTLKELETEVQNMRPSVEQSVKQLATQEEAMQSVSTQFNEALELYRKLLAEGPRLSDTLAHPSVTHSQPHVGQHGMGAQQSYVNPPQPQPGTGTQQYQAGMVQQPQSASIQTRQTGYAQPGMLTQPQHGIVTQPQPGMGMQSHTGMGTQLPQHTGMMTHTQPISISVSQPSSYQSSVYSTSPGRYVTTELPSMDMSVHPPPSLPYHTQQPSQPPPQHSVYGQPSYQPTAMASHPSHLTVSQPPPPYHPSHPQNPHMLPQPLL